MQKIDLFSFDFSRDLPSQESFPLNESTQDRTVKQVLTKDIKESEDYLIITGFTSLSNLIEHFGFDNFPNLKSLRVVIGFDIDERVSKSLPHYSPSKEIKDFWLKQNVSIKLCGPIINLIEKIKKGSHYFKIKNRLHAKIYIGNNAAILGSSNFSKSGTLKQTEANIRVHIKKNGTEKEQYDSIKKIAEYYYEIADDYNNQLIDLLSKLFKDATWEEALARAIAEILESPWMKDYPALYQAIISQELWPSQKIGIAKAMKIIQDQGRVLIADPTGSGKTKFATALAYTLFHWLWENGLKDRSTALIICPRQVMDNWQKERDHYTVYNQIESMGRLSLGKEKTQRALHKKIEESDILVIDEAHNYLHPYSKRSLAISPKGSTHVILSTATPINKKAEDLLRLVELLDIDNLSDNDLATYLKLRKNRKKQFDHQQLDTLRKYINHFIVRRTKKELNKMIDREPEQYRNRNHHTCKYPKTHSHVYKTGENSEDKKIAAEIKTLTSKLKGIHYLQQLKIPQYITREEEKKAYILQRFNSAPALAAFMIRSTLRSSNCALIEYLHGTQVANKIYGINCIKTDTGNIVGKIEKCSYVLPRIKFHASWIPQEHDWIINEEGYKNACITEINTYKEISLLTKKLSGQRERKKAHTLIEKINEYGKILAFDSTVITLEYLSKLLKDENVSAEILIATGQNNKNKNLVKELFSLDGSHKKIIALCSDAMSEGINLPDAKALVLLDMPSVLRLIEQRIGRLERMDSEHKEIFVFWPNDSDEFSLKSDQRLIDILVMTESLIRNNVDIPETIYNRYLKNGLSVENVMKAYEEFSSTDAEWEGVQDSTQSLYSLIDGKEALINEKTYKLYKDVEATVKTAISFVESEKNFHFFAFRGDASRSPKWLFIDERNNAYTDFAEITKKLKEYLNSRFVIQRRWKDVEAGNEVKKIVRKLRLQEKRLLPHKKRRALETGERILNDLMTAISPQDVRYDMARMLLMLFDLEVEADDCIDFDHFSQLWLSILVPALDLLRKNRKRKRKIITLKDLKLKDIVLDERKLRWLLDNCKYSSTLDEIVASCIIGIPKH